jgi:hypothetical protein
MTYIHLLPLAMTGLHDCDKVICKVQGEAEETAQHQALHTIDCVSTFKRY